MKKTIFMQKLFIYSNSIKKFSKTILSKYSCNKSQTKVFNVQMHNTQCNIIARMYMTF